MLTSFSALHVFTRLADAKPRCAAARPHDILKTCSAMRGFFGRPLEQGSTETNYGDLRCVFGMIKSRSIKVRNQNAFFDARSVREYATTDK